MTNSNTRTTTRKRSSKSPTHKKIDIDYHASQQKSSPTAVKASASPDADNTCRDKEKEQCSGLEEEKVVTTSGTQGAVVVKKEGCQKCGKDNHHNLLLLCEYCNDEYHTYCLDPPLDRVPEGDFFCDKCKSLKVLSKNDNLDILVACLPPAFTRRFGEIIWAHGGIGFGWWPACIYDPRLTVGGARKLALKNIGKKHLVYFFGCSDTPFTVLPDNKCLAWEEGLLEEHDLGKTARAIGRARTMMFEWALQAATAENDKPIEYRLDWNRQGEDSCALLSSVVHCGGSSGQGGGKGGKGVNGKLQGGKVLESKREKSKESGDTDSNSCKRDSSGSSVGERLASGTNTRKQSGHGEDSSVKRIKIAKIETDKNVISKDAPPITSALPSSSTSISPNNEKGEIQSKSSIKSVVRPISVDPWSFSVKQPTLEPDQTTHLCFVIHLIDIFDDYETLGYLLLSVGVDMTLFRLRGILTYHLENCGVKKSFPYDWCYLDIVDSEVTSTEEYDMKLPTNFHEGRKFGTLQSWGYGTSVDPYTIKIQW